MRRFDDDSAAQDALLEQARERLAKYQEMRAERFLGDGYPETIRPLHRIEVHVDLDAADRIIYGECPECGRPNKRFHSCPAKD